MRTSVDLHALQRALAVALRDDACTDCPHGLSPRGVEVHRGTVREARVATLALSYPALRRAMGEPAFRELALHTERAGGHFPANLHDYGAELCEVIDGSPWAQVWPALADVARLEWLCHVAHYADDEAPFDYTALAALPAEDHERLVLRVARSTAVLASDWPVAALREQMLAGSLELVGAVNAPAPAPGAVLVVRDPAGRVRVEPLPFAARAFLQGCVDGQNLGHCAAAALAIESGFPLHEWLPRWIQSGVLAGWACSA